MICCTSVRALVTGHCCCVAAGEYVAVEFIESVLGKCDMVEQVWVYGSSYESVLVAVVVPNRKPLERWAQEQVRPASAVLLYGVGQQVLPLLADTVPSTAFVLHQGAMIQSSSSEQVGSCNDQGDVFHKEPCGRIQRKHHVHIWSSCRAPVHSVHMAVHVRPLQTQP
jgi:hypothetical protein